MSSLLILILIVALCLVVPGLLSAIITVLIYGAAILLVLLALYAICSDWS